jgi:acyl dehydratase
MTIVVGSPTDLTEDHQWIHLDAERAASGPFGTTIVHGYLTLSLTIRLTEGLIEVGNTAMMINYGLDSVRFLQPVASGSRVRATSTLDSVEETPRGFRTGITVTVEIEGEQRPALVAKTIALFVPADPPPADSAPAG